jgi:succinate-acetate transporter protein
VDVNDYERHEPIPTAAVVRPLASPLPLGFLGLFLATVSFAALQLHWVADSQSHTIALAVLASTVPLQLLACVMGFLARDPAAATGMGLLAGGWGAASLATLSAPPGTTSGGLGVVLCCVGMALVVPAVAALTKPAACVVMGVSAVRFGTTGVGQLRGSDSWLTAAGWVGLVLAVVSVYAAVAFELERRPGSSPVPVGRRAGRPEDQGVDASSVAREPGVRGRL